MLTAICLLFLPANIVMEETRERRFGKGVYSDVMLGLYLVRGENIVLLGEVVSG
jgi:U6 snRNA-associated Sm-like protein LSm1